MSEKKLPVGFPEYKPKSKARAGRGEGSLHEIYQHGCGRYLTEFHLHPCGNTSAKDCPDAKKVWRATESVGKDAQGKWVKVSGIGPTKAAAMENLRNNSIRRGVAMGDLPQSALRLTQKEAARTFESWFEEWVPSKTRWSEQTRAQYETKARLHLLPYFGSRPIRAITPEEVSNHFYVTLPELKDEDGQQRLGASAIRNTFTLMNMCFDAALKKGHVNLNPCASIETPPTAKKDKRKAKQLEVLQQWVPMKLMKHVRGHKHEARWLLALFAVRQGEALGITDDQLMNMDDPERAYLVIDKQLARRHGIHGCGRKKNGSWVCGKQADDCPHNIQKGELYLKNETKTSAGERGIPLVEPLYTAMKNQLEHQKKLRGTEGFKPKAGMENLLFTQDNGQPIRVQKDRLEWKQIVEEVGVESDLVVHDARKLAASLMISLGVFTMDQVMKTGGWNDQRTLTSVYSHQGPEYVRDSVKAYGEKLMEELNKDD